MLNRTILILITVLFLMPSIVFSTTRAQTEPDSDNDGVPDSKDAFPNDPNEQQDTDNDGTGDNEDTDDDNDRMPDEWEITHSLDPNNSSDAILDADDDGFSNLNEYLAETNPLDYNDYPEFVELEDDEKEKDMSGFFILLFLSIGTMMIISIIIGRIIIEKRKHDEEFWVGTFGAGSTSDTDRSLRDEEHKYRDKYLEWQGRLEQDRDRPKRIKPKHKYKLEIIGGPPDTLMDLPEHKTITRGVKGRKRTYKLDARFKGRTCVWCDKAITRKYIKRCPEMRTSKTRCRSGPFCSEKCLNEHLETVPHNHEVNY